jgi:hypothetical protein
MGYVQKTHENAMSHVKRFYTFYYISVTQCKIIADKLRHSYS